MKKQDQILTDEEIELLRSEIQGGANVLQASYVTAIPEERIYLWIDRGEGKALIKKWEVMRTYNALKLFHQPKDHKEAEAVLKRHPLTKKDYSERSEITGADGKDLPVPIINISNDK